jgi:hypothetical protein
MTDGVGIRPAPRLRHTRPGGLELTWYPELYEPPRPLPHLGTLRDMPERDRGGSPAPNVAVLHAELPIDLFQIAGQLDLSRVALDHAPNCVDMATEPRVAGLAPQVKVVGEDARELGFRRLTPVDPIAGCGMCQTFAHGIFTVLAVYLTNGKSAVNDL